VFSAVVAGNTGALGAGSEKNSALFPVRLLFVSHRPESIRLGRNRNVSSELSSGFRSDWGAKVITIFDQTLPLSCVATLATGIIIAAAILMFG
jgi:hypothetical protein